MILANGSNITKSEKLKGVWILSVPTVYIYIYICICMCIYICVYIYMCVCIYVCIYMCVCECSSWRILMLFWYFDTLVMHLCYLCFGTMLFTVTYSLHALLHTCLDCCYSMINWAKQSSPISCIDVKYMYSLWQSQDVFIGVAREGPATSLGWHRNLHYFNI